MRLCLQKFNSHNNYYYLKVIIKFQQISKQLFSFKTETYFTFKVIMNGYLKAKINWCAMIKYLASTQAISELTKAVHLPLGQRV